MGVGRNEPCPCGSGQKAKKCCLGAGTLSGYSRPERTSARLKLLDYTERHLGPQDDEALDEFWEPLDDLEDELEPQAEQISEQLCDDWFMFDRPLLGGGRVIERFLKSQGPRLGRGERAHLDALAASTMRLYEIEALSPEETLTLKDVLEGTRITVQERQGSRSLHRYDWVAARVVTPGASGKPELEGVIEITRPYREAVRAAMLEQRAAHLATAGAQLEDFYRDLPPLFHEVWARSILDPAIPQLANTDGEELVETRVQFEVLDRAVALGALKSSPLEHLDGDVWGWSQANSAGQSVSMGTVKVGERTLELIVNSVARGARGRELLEQLAGPSIRHRATTHEDLQRKLKEAIKQGVPDDEAPRDPGISPELQEALVLDHYATHYREWLHLPVPAIDDLTPRDASTRPAMKARLVELLKGLDGLYQRALEDNQPAYDPSWMWDELGLAEATAPHPPPLAFERVCSAVPGLREALTRVADQRRSAKAPPFDDDSLRLDLEVQRLVREAPAASAWTATLANFELERRKAFWVDEALAFMLANTEFDVRGAELRVPFASFALVFTDRHVLSMGERLLARQPGAPLKGRYLQIVTVFVTERGERDDRSLEVCFCLDALGAELPVQLKHHIPFPARGWRRRTWRPWRLWPSRTPPRTPTPCGASCRSP